MSYLDILRSKSDAAKVRIAVGGGAVVTILLVFLYLLISGVIMPRTTGLGKKPDGLFKVLFGSSDEGKPVAGPSSQNPQVTPVAGTLSQDEPPADIFGGEQVFTEEVQ